MSSITKMEKETILTFEVPKVKRPCIRCGRLEPINTRSQCYQCFVWSNIERIERSLGREWLPGDEHPAWCDCTLPEHFKSKEARLNALLN